MKKRFTDADKCKDKWYKGLSLTNKLFWQYLLDNCDHAGIWIVDFGLASYQTDLELDEEEITNTFNDKVAVLEHGNVWYIPQFPILQYVTLNATNNCHRSAAKILARYCLLDYDGQPVASPWLSRKDQDKAKELDSLPDAIPFQCYR